MVQICSSCLEKNSHRAEGGDPTTVNTSSNNNLDALNNSNSNSSTIAYNSNHYHNNGSVSGQNTMPSGRYTPSDKSVSNLDAAGNVRFKVSLLLLQGRCFNLKFFLTGLMMMENRCFLRIFSVFLITFFLQST